MIRFDEYKCGTWELNSIEDRKQVADEIRQFAKDNGDEFSDEEIRTIFEDYDFIASGKYKRAKVYYDALLDDYHNSINGTDLHEKRLYQAFKRLLEENYLLPVFFLGGKVE